MSNEHTSERIAEAQAQLDRQHAATEDLLSRYQDLKIRYFKLPSSARTSPNVPLEVRNRAFLELDTDASQLSGLLDLQHSYQRIHGSIRKADGEEGRVLLWRNAKEIEWFKAMVEQLEGDVKVFEEYAG